MPMKGAVSRRMGGPQIGADGCSAQRQLSEMASKVCGSAANGQLSIISMMCCRRAEQGYFGALPHSSQSACCSPSRLVLTAPPQR